MYVNVSSTGRKWIYSLPLTYTSIHTHAHCIFRVIGNCSVLVYFPMTHMGDFKARLPGEIKTILKIIFARLCLFLLIKFTFIYNNCLHQINFIHGSGVPMESYQIHFTILDVFFCQKHLF